MKITKSQLKQIIKEELSNIVEGGLAGHYQRPIGGSEAIAGAILGPGGLREIAAAAGVRMTGLGNQVTSPYHQILDEIEEYIKTDCARNIMEIVGRYQGPGPAPEEDEALELEEGSK